MLNILIRGMPEIVLELFEVDFGKVPGFAGLDDLIAGFTGLAVWQFNTSKPKS